MGFEFLNPKQLWTCQSLQYEQVTFEITAKTVILKLHAFLLGGGFKNSLLSWAAWQRFITWATWCLTLKDHQIQSLPEQLSEINIKTENKKARARMGTGSGPSSLASLKTPALVPKRQNRGWVDSQSTHTFSFSHLLSSRKQDTPGIEIELNGKTLA